MIECVMLDTLPEKANLILNIFVGSESSDVSDGVDRGAKGGVFTEL